MKTKGKSDRTRFTLKEVRLKKTNLSKQKLRFARSALENKRNNANAKTVSEKCSRKPL